MRTSREQIRKTIDGFAEELSAARSYTDDMYSQEGLDKTRKLLEERARSKYAKEVASHREALYYDRDPKAFDQYRPRLDWNKAADVAKAQAKWAAVERKLDAGLSIGQIIATADNTTLVAINEFWTDYAETQQAAALGRGQEYEAPDTSDVHRAVDDRAAEIGGTAAANALQTARDAAGLHAHADVMLKYAEQDVQGINHGMDPIFVAVSAQQAEAKAMHGTGSLVETHDASQSTETSAEAAVSE
ncbi:hypothetical protein [Brevibacterium spongiae]|uniref:Uncharacterized protein n=1 Tax=Brevibacterium spongiae TaxID=2909672 RepID=A0ABY5SLI5_9MICO|nr:hypothetical protein [Brevibacterium spongiae]UVI35009.1 hypothetical protein L1F31_12880 [Brevibacterium spongiae]